MHKRTSQSLRDLESDRCSSTFGGVTTPGGDGDCEAADSPRAVAKLCVAVEGCGDVVVEGPEPSVAAEAVDVLEGGALLSGASSFSAIEGATG